MKTKIGIPWSQVARLVLILSCALVCGCPIAPETNAAACERALRHTIECTDDSSTEQDEQELILFCDSVPETSECDWPGFAACITAATCEDQFDDPCVELFLPSLDCFGDTFATLFEGTNCGAFKATMAILPLALIVPRFVRRRRYPRDRSA